MANNNPFAVSGISVVTPKGKALWCKYAEPDRKFVPEGKLETQLVLDPNDPATQAFVNRLESLQDTAFEETLETLGTKGKGVTKRDLYTEDEEGNLVFKFTLKNVDGRKAAGKQHEIQVVDSMKRPVTDKPLVGNGSVVRIASFVYPYYMAMNKQIGLSMMWNKMQILDLVEYTGGGGGGSDFDVEDGFSAGATPVDEDDF